MNKFFLGVGVLLFSVVILAGCTLGKQEVEVSDYVIDQGDFVNGKELVEGILPSSLSEDEIAGLVLMREEEKLARDVYNFLGEKWGIKIFTNIAKSEQTHTDAVKVLLERYEITDPIKDDGIGIFTSEELKKLYDDLVAKGSSSSLDALIVGATIEDLDIADLNKLLANTDNADIISTYNNLNKGSRNHLRAFMRQIESNGGSYSPQYISQDEFDSIVSSNQERGRVQ
jgi:hypothetical protein